MDKLSLCRICLANDIPLWLIVNKCLQEMYEVLTKLPFVTDDSRPMLVCYICCARLHNSYKLAKSCLRSEELFQQMLCTDAVIPKKLEQLQCTKMFGIKQVAHLSYPSECDDTHLSYSEEPDDNTEEQTVIDHFEVKIEPITDMTIENQQSSDTDAGMSRTVMTCIKAEPEDRDTCDNKFNDFGEPDDNTDKLAAIAYIEVKIEPNTDNQQAAIRLTESQSTEDTTCHEKNKLKEEKAQRKSCLKLHEKHCTCNICSENNDQKRHLIKHNRIHSGDKPLKCNARGNCVTGKSHLVSRNRILTGDKPDKCNVCTVKSDRDTRAGDKPYVCTTCNKSFARKSDLLNHDRMLTGEKPYVCKICSKCFARKTDLAKHSRIHTGEKPYVCSVCSKCFARNSDLVNHNRIHTGDKPFKCNTCPKSFNLKANLTTHIRTHTGEKPFKCSNCCKCFLKRSDLVRHNRIHTGDKPYKCNVCSKGFIEKSKLVDHSRVHTGDKPFKCNICSKCFSHKRTLDIHLGRKKCKPKLQSQ